MSAILQVLQIPATRSIRATVEAASPISLEERAALIVQHKAHPNSQALIDLLRSAQTNLIELKFHNRTFHVISDIPLKPGESLTIKPTAQHFVTTAPGQAGSAIKHEQPVTTTSAAKQGLENATSALPYPAKSVTAATRPNLPLFAPNTSPPGAPAESADRLINLPPSQNGRASNVLRSAIARDLPIAEPLAKQLTLASFIHRDTSIGTQGDKLLHALGQLRTLPLTISPGKPPPTQDVFNSLLNNGMFHESRLAKALLGEVNAGQLNHLKEYDAKSLLLQLQTGLTNLVGSEQPRNKPAPADGVAKLLAQLFNTLPSQQATTTTSSAVTQQTQLLLKAVESALAQIQLNQTQSLVKHLAENAPAQTALTFDVPLRLPDGIFNMFVALFDPEQKSSKSPRQNTEQKRKQWKMLLGLDLGSCGELTTEVTAEENTVEAVLWANKESLREAARKNLPDLVNQLSERGIEVKHIRCSEEEPPRREAPTAGGPLVDLET